MTGLPLGLVNQPVVTLSILYTHLNKQIPIASEVIGVLLKVCDDRLNYTRND